MQRAGDRGHCEDRDRIVRAVAVAQA